MAITLDEVHEIALLARLRLSPDEAERLRGDLSAILAYVDKLKLVDTTGVEPMTHAVPVDLPLREDVVGASLSTDEALAGAPSRQGDFFAVPRVVERPE
jgi:aspartyl-tRNA(Asn)/glutamyl-tRNA(Gln) amidotransferase subunit C